MLNKYVVYFSKNNHDINMIALLKSKLSRSSLYEQLYNMYKHDDIYICEYRESMCDKIIDVINVCTLKMICNKNNVQMYTL